MLIFAIVITHLLAFTIGYMASNIWKMNKARKYLDIAIQHSFDATNEYNKALIDVARYRRENIHEHTTLS